MPELPFYSHRVEVRNLSVRRANRFELIPDERQRAAIAEDLSLLKLRKLNFKCELLPVGSKGWKLNGQLGATVIQPCVVTLEPVTTRLEQEVSHQYLQNIPTIEDAESEIPEDVNTEELGEEIDIGLVMFEALSLAVPDYPRTENAALDKQNFTEPGETPMSDEDTKPFASLAALRDKLNKGD